MHAFHRCGFARPHDDDEEDDDFNGGEASHMRLWCGFGNIINIHAFVVVVIVVVCVFSVLREHTSLHVCATKSVRECVFFAFAVWRRQSAIESVSGTCRARVSRASFYRYDAVHACCLSPV